MFPWRMKLNKSTCDSGYSQFLFLFGYLLGACVSHEDIKMSQKLATTEISVLSFL